MLKELELDIPSFRDTYRDSANREQIEYHLPKRECLILASGYNIKLRAGIIDRWEMLESEKRNLSPVALPDRKEKALSLANVAISAANAFGFTGNQGLLSADKAIKSITGYSALELLGNTHLISEHQELNFTPTDLGKRFNMSANAFNKILSANGFQFKENKQWIVTEKGKSFAVVLDTGKKHSSGTPVQQVKWREGILSELGLH